MRSGWVSRVVLGLLAVYLLIGIAVGLRNTALRLRSAVRSAGLSAGEMRTRILGPEYVTAVERVRRMIPVDEPYLLRELDEPGAMLWTRFDLLPRRAILDTAPPPDARSACLRAQVRWMVVAAGMRRPPLILERPPTVPPGCPPAPWRREAR
ncbi:MAG TPA: hypothetical protein VF179_12930 [Thermoanaerobaculia bacterium]|nr:hypothetical protein [Thermoanaerobaculia bacterium]